MFVSDGDEVVLELQDKRIFIARVKTGKRLKFGQAEAILDDLIGAQYGSAFAVLNKHFVQITCHEFFNPISELKNDDQQGGNNKELYDSHGKNQQLSYSEINELKSKLSGDQMVATLVANSTSFEQKTEFSRQKYVMKKKQKYGAMVFLKRACALTLCDAHFQKDPNRIRYLRHDTLAQLLCLANIHHGSRVISLDSIGGLLSSAVAERLGGSGLALHAYTKKGPDLSIARSFNFSEEIASTFHCVPLVSILGLFQSLSFDAPRRQQNSEIGEPKRKRPRHTTHGAIDIITFDSERANSLLAPHVEAGFTSCVAVADYRLSLLLPYILRLLNPGSQFVVFSPDLHTLLLLQTELRNNFNQFINFVEISESWMREYQVLPNRTHPGMNLPLPGGYLLTATRIMNPYLPVEQNQPVIKPLAHI